jgi:putative SOS response-associated peptidase YedK
MPEGNNLCNSICRKISSVLYGAWVTLAVEENKAFNSAYIELFNARTVMKKRNFSRTSSSKRCGVGGNAVFEVICAIIFNPILLKK